MYKIGVQNKKSFIYNNKDLCLLEEKLKEKGFLDNTKKYKLYMYHNFNSGAFFILDEDGGLHVGGAVPFHFEKVPQSIDFIKGLACTK